MSQIARIRNFSIIAHVDHGKSTLADRLLEVTGTIEKRKMKEQVLDKMELERERGITIKLQPVRMRYRRAGEEYILNLIDTPGHIDFSYEVSRAQAAVEGAILLVDATQGVQAQTLSVLRMAQESGLVIVPVVTKIDTQIARVPETKKELAALLQIDEESVLGVSGKTGEGVPELLAALITTIPPPKHSSEENATAPLRALIFDLSYSGPKGVIAYVRVFQGSLKKGEQLLLCATGQTFKGVDIGFLTPEPYSTEVLGMGEIGYIATGIKEADKVFIGDTIIQEARRAEPLAGFREPQSMVWASVFPDSQDDFVGLRTAVARLHLEDAAFSYEEETSASLGRGFRCGFLGMLHLEIIIERLKREFRLALTLTSPTISYEIVAPNGEREKIYSPAKFPDTVKVAEVYEPWVDLEFIVPVVYSGAILQSLYAHEAEVGASSSFGDGRLKIEAAMPLRELMREFFDEVKRLSSGYASFSYKRNGMRKADVVRLDILVADEVVTAFSAVVAKHRAYEEARTRVDRLYEVLPKQLFVVKIQGRVEGRILASKTLSALKKDVTGYLYGGDITRKMKLWEKQKKGKKKLKARGKVDIPHEVFLKMVKHD